MTFKSCATCIHVRVVKTVGNRKEMECRFNPPMPLMVPQNHPVTGQMSMGLMSAFAPVSDDVWCGQHSTKADSLPVKAFKPAVFDLTGLEEKPIVPNAASEKI